MPDHGFFLLCDMYILYRYQRITPLYNSFVAENCPGEPFSEGGHLSAIIVYHKWSARTTFGPGRFFRVVPFPPSPPRMAVGSSTTWRALSEVDSEQ